MHESSMTGMAYFRDKYLDPTRITKILDIGSMDVNGSYKDILNSNLWIYKGADLEEGRNVDIVLSNPEKWQEIPDDDYHVVISGQAFEHMEHPWEVIKEVARVLRKDGLCCIIAPKVCPEHAFPRDCWRFMSDGMHVLAKIAGLEVLEVMEGHDSGGLIIDTMLIARKP